jgi:hypothetical protein
MMALWAVLIGVVLALGVEPKKQGLVEIEADAPVASTQPRCETRES